MKMDKNRRGFQISFVVLLISVALRTASSEEAGLGLPKNHRLSESSSNVPEIEASKLKMEARIDDEDGLDLKKFAEEDKDARKASVESTSSSATSKGVSYVIATSEPRRSFTDSSSEFHEREGEVLESTVQSSVPVGSAIPEDRGLLRTMRVSPKDSYLHALDHSHVSRGHQSILQSSNQLGRKMAKINRRDYQEGPVYRPEAEKYGPPAKIPSSGYGPPDFQVGATGPGPTQPAFLPTPSDSYSLPVHSFDSFAPASSYGNHPQTPYGASSTSYAANPQTSYGVPQQGYGSPQQIPENTYGPPPQNAYGPPAGGSYLPPQIPQQAYGPPVPTYGAPYALPGMSHLPSLPTVDFSWPFALKLNAFTVAKILLKLVIFKMIVKFIAVICLLLFIPKLEIVKKDDKNDYEEEGRSNTESDRLDLLTSMVMGSLEKFAGVNSKKNSSKNCTSLGCRLRRVLTSGESWSDYTRLFGTYVLEEQHSVGGADRMDHGTKTS